jgi:Tfp pilus assembly protein PilF
VKDAQNNTSKMTDYATLLTEKADPVAAAAQAFGDLKQLQSALDRYISGLSFSAFRLTKPLVLDEAAFKTEAISSLQADAIRADFLAYNQREKDARALLDRILQEDPKNTLAHETMGYLEFRAGHIEQAQNWYEQAVQLDSQSYLANYYYATLAMNHGLSGPDTDKKIEAGLQNAIKLNPSFAPSYDRLAVFYAMRGRNLDQAHMLNLQAIQLEPTNIEFRLNTARVLLSMHRETSARGVLEAALKVAKKPEEVSAVQNELEMVQRIEAQRGQAEEEGSEVREAATAADESSSDTYQTAKEEPLTGPHRIVSGTVKNVRCSAPASIDMDVESGGKTIPLHSGNFYKIRFSALNYVPKPAFQPCTDLEGLHGRLEYIESAATKVNGVVAIELHK